MTTASRTLGCCASAASISPSSTRKPRILDLEVGAAEILDVAVFEAAREITALVELAAGLGAEGIGNEAFSGQLGSVEIAARDAGSSDIDLARDADRHGLARAVEQVERQIRNRAADDAGAPVRQVGAAHRTIGDVDRRLGDTIHVDELRLGVTVAVPPWAQIGDVEGLAAEDHIPQAKPGACLRGGGLVGTHELAEGGGRLVEHRDALSAEEIVENIG
ncbi:MAG: hypothetical protein QM820_53425 [Minicystis sp.]